MFHKLFAFFNDIVWFSIAYVAPLVIHLSIWFSHLMQKVLLIVVVLCIVLKSKLDILFVHWQLV